MKLLLQILALIALAFVVGLGANSLAEDPLPLIAPADQFEVEVPEEMKAEESEIMDYFENGTAFFIDARSKEAFTEGHIPGAFSIPYTSFENGNVPDQIEILPRDITLVVYCDGADCHASREVADHLLELGFKKEFIEVFHGGWSEWQKMGGEVETGEPL